MAAPTVDVKDVPTVDVKDVPTVDVKAAYSVLTTGILTDDRRV